MKNLLSKMESSVGTEDPIEYFKLLTQAIGELYSSNLLLKDQLNKIERNSALSIMWDEQIALTMLSQEIDRLRASDDKDLYFDILKDLKTAYTLTSTPSSVTCNYQRFCQFWIDKLGYHPFLNYRK